MIIDKLREIYPIEIDLITKNAIKGRSKFVISISQKDSYKFYTKSDINITNKESLEALFNKYKENYPTILLGDFNSRARDKESVVQELFNMKNIGNASFSSQNPENTFDTKKPFERIDYIFYTKNSIEYVSGKVLNEFGQASDHLPVFMEFRLKN